MAETRVNRRKVRIGVVVSDKMDKTIVVKSERKVRHPCTVNIFVVLLNTMFMMKIMNVKWATQ